MGPLKLLEVFDQTGLHVAQEGVTGAGGEVIHPGNLLGLKVALKVLKGILNFDHHLRRGQVPGQL